MLMIMLLIAFPFILFILLLMGISHHLNKERRDHEKPKNDEKQKYEASKYKKESGNDYDTAMNDKGVHGEYLIFNTLDIIQVNHKMLTNVYIPKGNDQTSEVDIIYLHETGIYVIESKNYSGWVFGSERNKFWTQAFKSGRKEQFPNPIRQNENHIKYLQQKLKDIAPNSIKSIIVFGSNCTLKKLEIDSENVKVIYIFELTKLIRTCIVNSPIVFTEQQIDKLYQVLSLYTCVSNDIKEKHIQNIREFKK